MITVISNGVEEPIKGIIKDSCEITRSFDGHSMSLQVIKLEDDPAFELLTEDAQIEVDNERYTIVSVDDVPPIKALICVHEFYDIYDDFVEGTLLDGIYSIQNALTKAFSNSPDWAWSVADTFDNAFLSGFGEDNSIALFQKILQVFGAEYELSSATKQVTLKKRVGTDLDEQVRYKHNLVSISRKIDANNVKTAVKVYYNVLPNGRYRSSLVYESPNKNAYRRTKWAKPLYLDHITNDTDAIKAAQGYLQDKAIISITAELASMQDAGFMLNDIDLGDSFWLIDERLNEEDRARVVEVRKYPLSNRVPVVSFANRVKNMSDAAIKQQQQHNNLNNIAVKQGRYYNGVNITPENGIVIESENGVVLMLNATEGILLSRNGAQKFYVDTGGNVVMDGKLKITSGNVTMLESFMDDKGGRLLINDAIGRLNVKLGSEESEDFASDGGVIKLYSDNNPVIPKAELTATAGYECGRLRLRDQLSRVAVDLDILGTNGGKMDITTPGNNERINLARGQIIVTNANYQSTIIRGNEILVNLLPVATQAWVWGQGYATQSWVLQQINNAIAAIPPPSSS